MDIAIIYGSVRQNRQGIRAALFLGQQVQHAGHQPHLIDPQEINLPLLDKMYKEYDQENIPTNLQTIAQILDRSDAFIIVTGEYNHSIPPALKNILDHFQQQYHYKPSGIVSYSIGSFGGVRAAIQLRPILAELGTPSIPTTLPIPNISENLDSKGNPQDQAYHKRSDRFLQELFWYAQALKTHRETHGTPNR